MGGFRQQSCRIERWRGYIASSFFVCFPDGTRIESSQFRWRRAELPPDLDAARAAHDELVERVAALGWERHADGEPWFATEFIRLVQEPAELESPEHEPVLPLAPERTGPEPVERETVAPVASMQVAPVAPVVVAPERVEPEPVAPAASVEAPPKPVRRRAVKPVPSARVAAEPVEPEPVAPAPSVEAPPKPVRRRPVKPIPSAHVTAEPLELAPVEPAVSVQVAAEPVGPEPVAPAASVEAPPKPAKRKAVRPLPSVHVAAEPREQQPAMPPAAVHSAPSVVQERAVPAPPPPPRAAQPPRVEWRLAAATSLLRALAWRGVAASTSLLRALARRRLAAPAALRHALVRSSQPTFRRARAPGHRRIRFPRVVEVLVGTIVIAVVAVVWGVVIHTLMSTPKPVVVRGRPDAVVWNNRVFANRAVFAHWLSSRGLSYREWAKRHPDGERIISGRARPAPTRRAASR